MATLTVNATLGNDSVSNAQLENMAQGTLKGRAAGGGAGDPQDLTPDQASAILDAATDPFVRTSGLPSGVSDGDKGDITVSGSGATWKIDNGVVTNAKAANMAQATIKGRQAASGTGDPEDLTADQVSTILDAATDPFQRASRELTASLSSDFTTSSASYVDVTGLAVTLAANSRYMVLIYGAYQSANVGTGAMVSITRTGSPTVCNFQRVLYTTATVPSTLGSVGNIDDNGSAWISVDTANVDRHWSMTGIVVTGGSPCVIQVRAVRGGAANNITIRQGSSIVAHKVS